MRSIIIMAVLLGVAIGSSWAELDEQARFATACLDESNAKRAHDEFIGHEEDHSELFLKYIKLREARKKLGQKLGVADCSEVAKENTQVVALDDEQLLMELCHEQKALEVFLQSNQDNLLRNRLEKRLQRDGWRRDRILMEHKCPPIDHVDTSTIQELASKLKEFLQLSCKQRVGYEHILNELRLINKGLMDFHLGEENVKQKFEVAKFSVDEFCKTTYKDCCGQQLVEEARLEAIVPAAQVLVGKVDLLARDMRETYESEVDRWEEDFNHLCAIEHKTAKGKHFYSIREETLKSLHERVSGARKTLGKTIGAPRCPQNHLQFLNEGEAVPKIAVSSDCEADIKINLMCDIFIKARIERNRYGYDVFEPRVELRDTWCPKRNAFNKKKPVCVEQEVSVLTKEAEAEAQILLELADLEPSVEKAFSLKSSIKVATEEQLAAIRRIKKIFKQQAKEESDPKKKEKLLEAFKIVSEKKAQLKKLAKLG